MFRHLYLALSVIAFICNINTAHAQNRRVSFKITDENKKIVPNASVTLKDNNGNAMTSKTDNNGVVWFTVGSSANYSNARLTIFKEGAKADFKMPVIITDKTKEMTIEAPLSNNAIMVNDWPTNSGDGKLLEPTRNVNQTTDARINRTPNYVAVTWGPYKTDCEANPLATVPQYSPLSVESEKTLADAIGSACIGSAQTAVNALVDATESIMSVGAQFRAIWIEESGKNQIQASDYSKISEDLKRIVEQDKQKTKKAMQDAYEKASKVLKNIESFSKGPEMYVAKCMWDGIKKYTVTADLLTAKKNAEAYAPTKKAMFEKLEAIKKRIESGAAISKSDYDLFTNWEDVQEGIETMAEGINTMINYVSDINNFLSYETQCNRAITAAEAMLGGLLTDCRIRECDKIIKDGIDAGKIGLASARKFNAQMLKEESKWRKIINDFVGVHFAPKDRGWEYMSSNDVRLLSIGNQYSTWAKYHNTAIQANKDAKRIEATLTKLAGLCSRIEPVSATLNQRVDKYEKLYSSGAEAAENCEFDKAENVIKQLKQLENSVCGFFFPKPYGTAKSDALNGKIQLAKMTARCKSDWAGTWSAPTSWGEAILVITGSGTNISATLTHKKNNGFTDVATWTDCRIEGNTLTCNWTEKYADADKSAIRGGRIKVQLSGDVISGTAFEDYDPAFKWKSGISPYSSSMRKGAEWAISVKKKQ